VRDESNSNANELVLLPKLARVFWRPKIKRALHIVRPRDASLKKGARLFILEINSDRHQQSNLPKVFYERTAVQ
jgi:hypothetical protein